MKEGVSNLKKALFTLLFDQYDMPDIEIGDSDEAYVEHIAYALIEKNGDTCPFKNYSCEKHCKENREGCTDGLKINCDREPEDVWKDFFAINDSQN